MANNLNPYKYQINDLVVVNVFLDYEKERSIEHSARVIGVTGDHHTNFVSVMLNGIDTQSGYWGMTLTIPESQVIGLELPY